jgi:hypothetical protein
VAGAGGLEPPNGISIPSALAVLRLMTNSNLVGCTTGKSAGFSLSLPQTRAVPATTSGEITTL